MKAIIAIVVLMVLYVMFWMPKQDNSSFAADRSIDTAMLSRCDLPTDEPVIVFTTTWCPNCAQLKSMIKRANVAYYEIDAEKTLAGRQGFSCTGGKGYPHLIVEGHPVNIASGKAITEALKPYRS